MPLVTFSPNTRLSSDDMDANFALCVLTDTARTVTVTHTWSAAQLFADGTVGAPGVAVGELDCGIYRIGTNNLGIAVNGAKVLDIGTTGLGVTGILRIGTTVTTNATAGDVIVPQGNNYRSVNAAGTGTLSLVRLNTNNHVEVAGGTDSYPLIPSLAAASFLAAGAAQDGTIGIDTTNNRLVFYSGGARHYVSATGTF